MSWIYKYYLDLKELKQYSRIINYGLVRKSENLDCMNVQCDALCLFRSVLKFYILNRNPVVFRYVLLVFVSFELTFISKRMFM